MELILSNNHQSFIDFGINNNNCQGETNNKSNNSEINKENLLNFKLSINKILDELSLDTNHSLICSPFNSYKYPYFCLDNDEPIDLFTIKKIYLAKDTKIKMQ